MSLPPLPHHRTCGFPHTAVERSGRAYMVDLSEIIAGTSPVDALSLLILAAHIDSAQHQVVLQWPSVVGRSYEIEFKSSVDPGNAWDVLEASITGSGSLIERRDPISADMRFYRLNVRTR